jgi:hypothetical protein
VSHTPRTLSEILPVVVRFIVASLAAPGGNAEGGAMSQGQARAARALGELVRKRGDRVFLEVKPTLEEGLNAADAATRRGVCVGLVEIMRAAGRTMVRTQRVCNRARERWIDVR